MWLSQIDLRFFYDCSWLSVCFLPNGFILELVTTEWSIMLIVLSTETTRIQNVHQMDFFFKLLLFWHHLIHFWLFIKFWATLIRFDPLQSNLTQSSLLFLVNLPIDTVTMFCRVQGIPAFRDFTICDPSYDFVLSLFEERKSKKLSFYFIFGFFLGGWGIFFSSCL